jgi:tetratricopeptide (TPR) repeat protein
MLAEVMPVDVVLFDDGSLLAFDHWHQLGYGKVATFYEADGKVRWTKTLAELLGQAFVDRAQHSVSSIWWRKVPLEWQADADGKGGTVTLADENHLHVVLRDGGAKLVAVENLPDDPPRLLNRARALGDTPAALALLERAIAKDPDQLQAIGLYVEILQRGGQHAKVVAALDRFSKQWKPATAGYDLANIDDAWAVSLEKLGRTADAERVLRQGIAAVPAYTNPRIALARLLADHKRKSEADAVLDDFVAELLEAASLDTYALADVAQFYTTRGETTKAIAHYLKAYKKDQVTNQFLYAALAQAYEQLGNDAEAIRIDEQLLAYFEKMGSAFAIYVTSTKSEIARLRAKAKH